MNGVDNFILDAKLLTRLLPARAILESSSLVTRSKTGPYYGYETEPRKLILTNSGIEIECEKYGWLVIKAPAFQAKKTDFERVL